MTTLIYSSEKACPYVYYGINRKTGEYYFGYRKANIARNKPSSKDLGIKYFTSSKYIKPIFQQFEWSILAEFFDWEAAYDFEQSLIEEHFRDPKCLNAFHSKTGRFSMSGKTHSELAKSQMGWSKGLTKELHSGVASISTKLTGRTKEDYSYIEEANIKKRGRTKANHEGTRIRAEKVYGRTKENDRGVAKMAAALTGRTKETHDGVKRMADALRGRTKETHDGPRKISEAQRGKPKPKVSQALKGRNKHNDANLAKQFEIRTGQTMENSERVRKMANTKRGRTKYTCNGHMATALALTGRTKETHEYIELANIKKRILPADFYDIIREMRTYGESLVYIHSWLVNECKLSITYSGVRSICHK